MFRVVMSGLENKTTVVVPAKAGTHNHRALLLRWKNVCD